MKISKKDYKYYRDLVGDTGFKVYLLSAQKHNGRKAVLFGNYTYRRYYLFLDNNALGFDSWDSWQIDNMIKDYLETGSYWYVGIW